MEINFDTYTFRARVLPMYLTLAPAILLLAAVLPDALKIPLGSAAAVVFAPISFLVSQLSADPGKRLERRLFSDWGGPPTTRFLRHENHEFNEVTRDRVHRKLLSIGLEVPSRGDQRQNEYLADRYYESCVEELIRRTRDTKRFPLVFKSLVDYSFRRNLLGLKPVAVVVALVSLMGAAWSAYASWSSAGPSAVAIASVLIIGGILFAWLTWVTEHTVSLAANRYARFILEAAMDQE